MKYFLIIIILIVSSGSAFALPQKIQMIFLSASKSASILEMIDNINELKKFKKIAQNDLENCLPMGDGCFHPQLGYIEKSAMIKPTPKIVSDEELKLKTFNAVENNLVKCDKGNYFDIYCGQSSGSSNKYAEIQIWFDISSSIRVVDYNKDPNFCNRRSFLEKVAAKCKNKVDAYIYNTSLKQAGEYSSVCLSYGGNDEMKLIQWMKDANTKTLLLVTDIDEMSREMRDFLEKNGAKLIGDGVTSFTSGDLVQYANEFSKACN